MIAANTPQVRQSPPHLTTPHLGCTCAKWIPRIFYIGNKVIVNIGRDFFYLCGGNQSRIDRGDNVSGIVEFGEGVSYDFYNGLVKQYPDGQYRQIVPEVRTGIRALIQPPVMALDGSKIYVLVKDESRTGILYSININTFEAIVIDDNIQYFALTDDAIIVAYSLKSDYSRMRFSDSHGDFIIIDLEKNLIIKGKPPALPVRLEKAMPSA